MAKESKVTYEERNRIDDQYQNCHYYFTTTLSGIFYLAYVDNEYPEYLINQFFDDIQKEGLNLLLDEKGEITKSGREKLKTLAEPKLNFICSISFCTNLTSIPLLVD